MRRFFWRGVSSLRIAPGYSGGKCLGKATLVHRR